MKTKPTDRTAAAGRATAGRTLPRGKARGFTLVELLVVITIIGLLMMILVPTVRMALLQAELAKTKAWVVDIASGCSTYQSSFNIYPGQDDLANIGADGNGAFASKYTGSQYLAKTMMLGPTVYIPFRTDDLRTVPGKSGANTIQLLNTITDRSSNPMAVLYYVAKIGVKDVAQYDVNQNIEYITGNGDPATFPTAIKDARFTVGGVVPVNPGGIIVIAPGKDRKYLTEDDIRYP